MSNNEHQFEIDIKSLMTGEQGWEKAKETSYLKTRELALDLGTLLKFVKMSQGKAWAVFEKSCSGLDPEKEFYKKFESAVGTDGMIDVRRNAQSIVVAHNHPNGAVAPSEKDKVLTAALVEAGKTQGIPLLDHLILTEKKHYSFSENGGV